MSDGNVSRILAGEDVRDVIFEVRSAYSKGVEIKNRRELDCLKSMIKTASDYTGGAVGPSLLCSYKVKRSRDKVNHGYLINNRFFTHDELKEFLDEAEKMFK